MHLAQNANNADERRFLFFLGPALPLCLSFHNSTWCKPHPKDPLQGLQISVYQSSVRNELRQL